jgi:1,4-dihydroxy-2-naphthoate octaprenyltransferase
MSHPEIILLGVGCFSAFLLTGVFIPHLAGLVLAVGLLALNVGLAYTICRKR